MSSLFQRIQSAIPSSGRLEIIAPYKVIQQCEKYEERSYPAQTWVKTQMRHSSREQCTNSMFLKLLDYISGQENDKQVQIPMTAPVLVLVEPSPAAINSSSICCATFDDDVAAAADGQHEHNDKSDDYLFTMAFYLPAPFDEDPPKPTNPLVSIEFRPPTNILARTFGGFTNDRIDLEELTHLLSSLSEDHRRSIDPAGTVDRTTTSSCPLISSSSISYYCAGYDPPLKLFFRRNEIWLQQIRVSSNRINNQQQQHSAAAVEERDLMMNTIKTDANADRPNKDNDGDDDGFVVGDIQDAAVHHQPATIVVDADHQNSTQQQQQHTVYY